MRNGGTQLSRELVTEGSERPKGHDPPARVTLSLTVPYLGSISRHFSVWGLVFSQKSTVLCAAARARGVQPPCIDCTVLPPAVGCSDGSVAVQRMGEASASEEDHPLADLYEDPSRIDSAAGGAGDSGNVIRAS